MTPLKSIRKYCLWCGNQQTGEVKKCTNHNCVFFKFRLGKKTEKGSLIKIIRNKCFDCGEGTSQAIKKCDFNNCPLFVYRNGKSPAHKMAWANKAKRTNHFKNRGLIAKKTVNQGVIISKSELE